MRWRALGRDGGGIDGPLDALEYIIQWFSIKFTDEKKLFATYPRKDGQTNKPTNQRTDQRMDGRTFL